jgi:hypothetical protein
MASWWCRPTSSATDERRAMAASPPRLLTDPEALRAKLGALEQLRPAGLNDLELEALGEACFRLAVHPETTPAEAIRLLQRAAGCDPANPKLAYHLARLYFRHGELSHAAEWLQQAFLTCPTSHRIWLHVSVLQRELFRRRRRDNRYDADALRQRSERVLDRLRAGADEIDAALLDMRMPPGPISAATPSSPGPPAAPPLRPVRVVDAGVCRWSGIDDLDTEERLLADPTVAGRDDLVPLLDQAARRASNRPGGAAAFVVLAVAFVARGYPVATIRRLRRLLGEQHSPSLDLLDLVCSLYQVDEVELPARLADALAGDRIPPLLAAIIHHRRLLWRPLELSTLGPAYQAARRFLDTGVEPDDRLLETLEKRLRSAERELDAQRPEAMPDTPAEASAADLQARLELLEEAIERQRREVPWLRALVASRPPRALDESDRDRVLAITAAVQDIERDRKAALDALGSIKDAGADGLAEAGLDPGELEAGFQGIDTGALPRLLSKANRLVGPASEADADADGTGRDRLQRALRRIDRRVEERYLGADATFASYPASVWRLPEMRALRILVRGREAETRYRLGDLSGARRGWIRVRSDDRLRLGAVRNLAVADTLGGAGSGQVAWWRAYAESLYERAIAAGSLRPYASARADLHRDLGGAFAPSRLAAEQLDDQGRPDEVGVTVFLASVSRVRLFVRHRLLEFVNRKLDFTSPTLLLGVARDEDESVRSEAMNRLLEAVVLACASLPARVRPGFREIAVTRVRRAYLACQPASSRTLALDSSYEEEQARQLDWVKSVCRLKLHLRNVVWRHRTDFEAGLEPVAVLDELVLLDALPVANSPRLMEMVRHELRREEEALRETMRQLREDVLDHAKGTWAIGRAVRRPRL